MTTRLPFPTRVLLACTALLCGAACESTERKVPPQPLVPRNVVELERYEVRSDGQVLGLVLKFEIQDPAQPVRFWRIENSNGAWVGHANEQLRFSKRVPFQDDEQDLGIWPLEQGIAQLFDRQGEVQLRQLATAQPASVKQPVSEDR